MLRNRPAVVSLAYVVLLLAVAILASAIAPYAFEAQDLDGADLGSSQAHLFGTDQLGRDLLSRLVYGSRISLAVGIVDVLVVLLIGVPLGLLAGFFGRWIDVVARRSRRRDCPPIRRW